MPKLVTHEVMRGDLQFVGRSAQPSSEHPIADVDLAHTDRYRTQVSIAVSKLEFVLLFNPVYRFLVSLEPRLSSVWHRWHLHDRDTPETPADRIRLLCAACAHGHTPSVPCLDAPLPMS